MSSTYNRLNNYFAKFIVFIFSIILFYNTSLSSSAQSNEKIIEVDDRAVSFLDPITIIAYGYETSVFQAPAIIEVVATDQPYYVVPMKYEDFLRAQGAVEFEGSPRSNGISPVIRGFGGANVIKTIDGVRYNFNTSHDGSVFIDPSFLSKLEVLHGPSSHLYGSGGLGGLIAFETLSIQDLMQTPLSNHGLRTSFGYSSANMGRYLSNIYYQSGINTDMLAGLTLRGGDDIRLSDGTKLMAKDRIISGLLKFEHSTDEVNFFSLEYLGYRNEAVESNNPQISDVSAALSGSASDAALSQAVDKNSQSHTFIAKYRHFDPQQTLIDFNSNIYASRNFIKKEELTALGVDPIGTTKTRDVFSYGLNINNKSVLFFKGLDQTLFYGVEIHRDEQDGRRAGGSYGAVPSANTTYYSAYAQAELSHPSPADSGILAGSFVITPALRFDGFRTSFDNSDVILMSGAKSSTDVRTSPKITLSFISNHDMVWFASAGKSFRAPSFDEIFPSGQHFEIANIFTNNFIENTNLKPERSNNYEVGVGYTLAKSLLYNEDKLSFKAGYYYTHAKNLIDLAVEGFTVGTMECPFPNPMNPLCSAGSSQFVNIAKEAIDGIHIDFAYRSTVFDWDATYYYTNTHDKSSGAKESASNSASTIAREVPSTFHHTLVYKIPQYSTELGFSSKFAHSQKLGQFLNKRGYGVHNVFLRRKLANDVELSFAIENFFDKKYERIYSNVYEKGRDFKFSASIKW